MHRQAIVADVLTILLISCAPCAVNLVVAGIVFILRVFYLVAAALVGAREGVDTDFVSSCRVLYLEDPPEPDTISTALSTAAGVAATPLHHAMLRVSRRALAIVTWLSRQAAWRQALHFYTLALAGVFTGVPITSAQQLWQPVLAVPGCLLGAAAHFKQLPPLLDLTSVQVGYGEAGSCYIRLARFAACLCADDMRISHWLRSALIQFVCAGGLPITYYVVSCFLGSGSVSWLTGVALVASIVRYGRQLSATPSRTQLEARMVFSLLFWCAAARSAYIVAAAALAAGSFRRVPAALLLNPAVLPQALLLAFAGEAWTRQAVVDCMYSLEDGQKAAATVEAATPPHDASWWPLGACRAALQLTVALVRWGLLGMLAVCDWWVHASASRRCSLTCARPACCSSLGSPAGLLWAPGPTCCHSAFESCWRWKMQQWLLGSRTPPRWGMWFDQRRPTLAATARRC